MNVKTIASVEMETEVLQLLEHLASYTSTPGAGVTRLPYTETWAEGQRFVERKLKEAGLEVRYDNVGNLYGKLQGRLPDAPVVLTGSHVDTVHSGGKYDGAYGIAAGIAAVRYLKRTYGEPLRPLEVVSFSEEEGSRFPIAYWGSGNATGLFEIHAGDEIRDTQGVTLKTAMERAGFGRPDAGSCRRDDLHAFVELHIEQGMVLERVEKQIGIVDTIVGQRRYAISLQGAANHAGTTPMNMRQDAGAGAAECTLRLEALATQWGGPLVATVGRIGYVPNMPNVIAGAVDFTLDVRHTDEWKLSAFCELVLAEYERIASRRGLKLTVTPWLATRPVPLSPALASRTERICQDLSLAYRRMASGAGHDAQLFPPLCPTTMIFVPSRLGISHSPEEYTSPRALADGAAVLAALLYELAYEE